MAAWDITAKGSPLVVETGTYSKTFFIEIDETHYLATWSTTDVHAQVMAVNTSTWAVTTAGAKFSYGASYGGYGCPLIKMDDNHFFYVWGDPNYSIGYAGVFVVNTTTWAVSTAADHLSTGLRILRPSINQIDSTHILITWEGASTDGFSEVFAVNTTTWAVTTAATALEYDTRNGSDPVVLPVVDSNHFFNFYKGGASSYETGKVFTVNTTTWAVTADSATYWNTGAGAPWDLAGHVIDTNHVILFWSAGTTFYGTARVVEINTSTYAISTKAADFVFDTTASLNGADKYCDMVDSNHFIAAYSGTVESAYLGYFGIFEVNTGDWTVSTKSILNFDTQKGISTGVIMVDSSHFLAGWQNIDSDGAMQVFEIETSGGATPINIVLNVISNA